MAPVFRCTLAFALPVATAASAETVKITPLGSHEGELCDRAVDLPGDTGLHADMKTVVGEYHKPNLMMLNTGPNAVTFHSAAYAANELVRPAAVIAAHVQGASGAPRAKRPDDGVRRRREVRVGVLMRFAGSP